MYPGNYAKQHPDRPAVIMAQSGEVRLMPPLRLALISSRIYSGPSRWLPTTITPFSWKTTEYMETCAAGERTGLYYTCINSYLTAPELAYILQNSESRC